MYVEIEEKKYSASLFLPVMKSTFLFILFFFLVSPSLQAATLRIDPMSETHSVGQTFTVKVRVSSIDQEINAVAGNLSYSARTLSLLSVSKSGSLISLWAKEPSFSQAAGSLSFEGVLLSGFQGTGGTLLTLTFKAISEGVGSLSYNSSSTVLANDGQGTNVLTSVTGASYRIEKGESSSPSPEVTPDTMGVTVIVLPKEDPTNRRTALEIQAPLQKAGESYTIFIDGEEPIIWKDTGLHLYETLPYDVGTHTVRVQTKDVKGKMLEGSASFTIAPVQKPTITDYQSDTTSGQFLVLKGTADPFAEVEVYVARIGSTTEEEPASAVPIQTLRTTVPTNSSGTFLFVSSAKMQEGIYLVTLQSKTQSGNFSELSDSVKLIVRDTTQGTIVLTPKMLIGGGLILLCVLIGLIFLIVRLFARQKRHAEALTSLRDDPLRNNNTFLS